MNFFKALFRIAGKDQTKVIAVFAISAADADRAVRYLRQGAPDVPVWVFSLEPPAEETSGLCERVYVRNSSVRLLFAAERLLWPRWVALTAASWSGKPGHWAIKAAPFLIPPFRALIFNENHDSFAGQPGPVLRHLCHRLHLSDVPPFILTLGLQLLRLFRWVCRPSRRTHDGLRANLGMMSHRAGRTLAALRARWPGKGDQLKPYDVLVFPVIDWDYRFQRPQHLSLELARRGHRVFYISTTFIPAFGLSEPRLRPAADKVYLVDLPGSEDPPDIYRDIPNELQLAALEFGLRSLKEKLNIGATLSVVDYPFWAPLVRQLNNNIVLYDCMDDYLGFSNAGRAARELEPEIVREADLVVCSSTHLQERMRQLGREGILVRNAVDPEHFGPRPASLAIESNGQTVGYHGSITQSTDIQLLAYAARSLPEKRFVVIGRNDGVDLSGLESLPNVTLTGEVPYNRLPEYVHGFDVGLLPYRICDYSLAADPVKVWEYLSAGKPVVAVRLPEIERLNDLIKLADGPEQFVDAIRSALADDSPQHAERRRAFARENTWSQRCDAIEQEIASFFPKVSVIVLTHNQQSFTEIALSSLDRFTGYPNLEVVLVDNGSTDGTPELLALWGAARPYAKVILRSTNLGFADGNNAGVRASTGDYLVILNNDVCLTEGWIGTLLAHFRADPKLGILGPVTNSCGNESVVYIGEYADMEDMAILAHRYTRPRRGQRTELRVANFFCVMIPHSVWEQVGELDETFGIGLFEDDDYAMRVQRAGYNVACAEDVFVHHHASASIGVLPREGYDRLFDRNRRYFESKWGPWIPPVFRKEVQDRLAARVGVSLPQHPRSAAASETR
ncbi:MAG TPA: glycosyltransferase [Bryobacteraceae bacterium]|nr:glycosyltransferase [Bryobacteraceae bacterium]